MMTIGDYPDYLAVGYLANQNMLLPDDEITGIDHDDDLGVVVADFVPDEVAVTFALSGNSKWFSCRWSLGVLGALPPALPLDMVLVLVDALCLVDRSRAGTSTGLILSIRVAMVM